MSLTEVIAALLEQRRTEIEKPLEEAYPGAGTQKEDEPAPQGSSKKADFEIVNKGKGSDKGGAGGNRLAPGVAAKEEKPMKQGSSQEPGWEDLDSAEVGVKAAAKAKETDKKPLGKGAGAAPNFKTKANPTAEVNKASSKGNVHVEAVAKMFEGETTLSEEFKTKATSLFDALVTAAVTEQREALEEEVAALAVEEILKAEQALTEQVDKYLDYIADQWLEKNEAVVTDSLKTELHESFMAGLKTLFEEHYVTLPEGGTDVVAELNARIEELETELNATVEAGVEVTEEVVALKRSALLAEASVGLALTEAEKLTTLCAEVEFMDESTFKDKVAVIKESYFPKNKGAKPLTEEKSTEVVDVTTPEGTEEITTDASMDKYVDAIARQIKF